MPTMLFPETGKWYVECTMTTVAALRAGVSDYKTQRDGPDSGSGKFAGIAYLQGGTIRVDDSQVQSGLTAVTNGDIVGVAVDRDAGTVQFSINGTNKGSAVNISSLGSTEDLGFHVGTNGSQNGVASVNFGQRPFANQPTGFKALCTENLPEPVIKDPSKYFDTVLYTGNGANQTISSLGFQPDLVWFKSRETTYDHEVYDSVRGVEKGLYTNTTAAEFDDDDALTAFNSNGFTVGDDPACNQSNAKIVSYSWKKTASAGFDIVSYEGNTTAGRTVSHSLGVKPDVILVKNRDDGNQEWGMYHKDHGATKVMFLHDASTGLTNSIFWNDTEPSSSVFTVGTASTTNEDSLIAYLWSGVEGYSKFGSYEGNGNQDGPFIYTGFKPAWVLVKNTENNSSYWNLHDNKRDTYNPVNTVLYPNTSDDEEAYSLTNAASTNKLFLANGFKIWSTHDPELNANGEKYIYLAFAERPFKYANTQ